MSTNVRKSVTRILLVCAGLIASAPVVFAKPVYRVSFFNAYPTAVGSRLDDLPSISNHCGACHFEFTGGGPRNPYGAAVEAALPGYPNNDAGRQLAIHSIEAADSDGDGFSNLIEITDLANYNNTPTFPGLTAGNVGSTGSVDPADIAGYLTPTTSSDPEPPVVSLVSPNGLEAWTAQSLEVIQWTASDNVAVTAIDLFYRDSEGGPWIQVARDLLNSGSFPWHVHNTPTSAARVRVVARDAAQNAGEDQSDGLFTIGNKPGGVIASTLRDFELAGSQPFGAGYFQDRSTCANCHGGYDPEVEPDFLFSGSMMAHAARDPLFEACLAVTEEKAPGSGDFCIRCHSPGGWLSGHSNPNDGTALDALDRNGVSCDACHRLVDPEYDAGTDPAVDEPILQALAAVPSDFGNGEYVVDPVARRRGPFSDADAPHAILTSPFHRSSALCGTCHEVSNPMFVRTGDRDYALQALDQPVADDSPEVLLPLERTYSEWKASSFSSLPGVYAPEFAGNKPDGFVSTCQDCHMSDASGAGCNDIDAITREDLPLHDLTGGNTWVPGLIAQLYPGEVDAVALAAGAERARQMLQKSALVDVVTVAEGDSFAATVTVTNRTGHKLPTGYPEGRRMWLHVVARDLSDAVVYESGAYEAASGDLVLDADIVVYEAKMGVSDAVAQLTGLSAGETFHFALNDTVLKDNRIPPLGFSNATFAAFGGQPIESGMPGLRYADGQNWDASIFRLPSSAREVVATLYYQTTSKEYVEFLRDENTTNSAGQTLFDLWEANGRAAPVAMAADSTYTTTVDVAEDPLSETIQMVAMLQAGPNPFRDVLRIVLSVPRPAPARLELFDLQGRRVLSRDLGVVAPGGQVIEWDGRDDAGRDAGAGVFFARVVADGDELTKRIVRLR